MLQNPALKQTTNESLSDNDAMSLLSTFMLQGWVMTDQACAVPGCPVPIMRSKDGSIKFCVKHDQLPTSSSNSSAPVKAASPLAAQPAERDELEDRERRREQSSKASQLIGQRLLQRWTLLNETCPNQDCYAIPLMRDPAKHLVCVICKRTYNDELEEEHVDGTKETEDEPTEYKDEPTDDDDRPENGRHRKKQKTDSESSASPVSMPARKEASKTKSRKEAFPDINMYTSPIANKLQSLLRRVERSSDPVELKQLFDAIQAGAGAIKACSEASEACHKVSNKLELDY